MIAGSYRCRVSCRWIGSWKRQCASWKFRAIGFVSGVMAYQLETSIQEQSIWIKGSSYQNLQNLLPNFNCTTPNTSPTRSSIRTLQHKQQRPPLARLRLLDSLGLRSRLSKTNATGVGGQDAPQWAVQPPETRKAKDILIHIYMERR